MYSHPIELLKIGGVLVKVSLLPHGRRLRRQSWIEGLEPDEQPEVDAGDSSSIYADDADDGEHVRRIMVEEQDSGVGVAQEKQKLLFRSFSQVDTNPNRRFEGAGLGLKICRQLLAVSSSPLLNIISPFLQRSKI